MRDTALTLRAAGADALIIRHPASGAAQQLAEWTATEHGGPVVINAGDGTHEHPTQALLDALTIRQRLGDIEGKLDVLRVECTKCARKGRYSVRKLIEKYGCNANMMKWKEQLNGDCPNRDAHSMLERCDLICPHLPKVL